MRFLQLASFLFSFSFLVAVSNGQNLVVSLAPVSVEQYRVNQVSMSLFIARTTSGANAPVVLSEYTSALNPTVFTSALTFPEEVTIQTFPTFGAILAVVFSDNPLPKIERDLVFLCSSGYEIAASGAAVDMALKFNHGKLTHGPFKIPPTHKYFRVFAYPTAVTRASDTVAGGNALELTNTALVDFNRNYAYQFALVTITGH